MAKQSGFLLKQKAIQKALMDAAADVTRQMVFDSLQITLHTDFGWGYERIERLCEAWQKRYDECNEALNLKNPEADVVQEHMDRCLTEILAGRRDLIPFNDRYPDVKRITY